MAARKLSDSKKLLEQQRAKSIADMNRKREDSMKNQKPVSPIEPAIKPIVKEKIKHSLSETHKVKRFEIPEEANI